LDTHGIVQRRLFYDLLAGASTPILYAAFRLRARDVLNVPDGGCVIAANHVSNFDAWPLAIPLWPHCQLRFMAKAELWWFPLRLVLEGTGAFKIRRGIPDRTAIEQAVELCRAGEMVAMFPEGTRREKGIRKKFEAKPRTGAARIALAAGVPLVPAATKGADRLSRLGPLHVAYGAPIDLDDLRDRPLDRRTAQEATDRLMARIHELEASL
jgi:1-acyl-sn-glycerol-3-phosphate acyltransferase